jgi:hypothetical protein
MSGIGDLVIAACERCWDDYQEKSAGFVKAVAREFGIRLTGTPNEIIDQIRQEPWTVILSSRDAAAKAETALVLAGLKDKEEGMVVVVVPGPLALQRYPSAYWGQAGGGRKRSTLNLAWDEHGRDRLTYSFHLI